MWNCISGFWASLVAQMVKKRPAVQEARAQSLGRKTPGGGHGSPLQYSCLQNSVDRGAGWATVPGIPKSQTQEWATNMHAYFWTLISVSPSVCCNASTTGDVSCLALFFFRIALAVEVLCISLSILWLVFQFLYKGLLRFSLGLNWIYRSVWGE